MNGLPMIEPETCPAGADWVRNAFETHQVALVGYVHQLLGDLEQARDVVQDAFLRLCREDEAAVGPAVRPWLFTVCRHRALDVLRKERRMTPLPEEEAQAWESPDPAPSESAAEGEDAGRAVRYLRRLPDNQREVLLLKFQHALTYREISDLTGLSVGNVGFLIHTGLRSLRRWLGSGGAAAGPVERRLP